MCVQSRSVLACAIAQRDITRTAERAYEKIMRVGERLVPTVDQIGDEFGIRVANKRIAVTPVSMITEGASGDPVELARTIDAAAQVCGGRFHRWLFSLSAQRRDQL